MQSRQQYLLELQMIARQTVDVFNQISKIITNQMIPQSPSVILLSARN